MIDRILVADDEFLVRQFMEETVKRAGIEPVAAVNGKSAMQALDRNDIQMAFVDLKLGDVTGLDVLKYCRKNHPHVVFVLMTAYGTIETAVEAMKEGSFDFIIKPFTPDQANVLIHKAMKWLQLQERNDYFQREVGGIDVTKRIVGSSEQIQDVQKLVRRVAPTRATVLITGESGTGKELVANEVHRLSDLDNKRSYIRMNCASVPESLLESELFGHEKGAFTGATERRVGRFELADGGTLLLDEIGEINPAMQAKLLRVLQESEFERVGGGKTIQVDVRVIATTNRDLKQEVVNGNFREDLYYRLNVFPIHVAPLRDRSGDIVELARFFLKRQEQRLRRSLQFNDEALDAVMKYHWPGNIREMENVVERVAILEDGPVIGVEALPREIIDPQIYDDTAINFDHTLNLALIEKAAVKKALLVTGGHRTRAAELLGFTVRTLRNKLNEYREAGEEWAEKKKSEYGID